MAQPRRATGNLPVRPVPSGISLTEPGGDRAARTSVAARACGNGVETRGRRWGRPDTVGPRGPGQHARPFHSPASSNYRPSVAGRGPRGRAPNSPGGPVGASPDNHQQCDLRPHCIALVFTALHVRLPVPLMISWFAPCQPAATKTNRKPPRRISSGLLADSPLFAPARYALAGGAISFPAPQSRTLQSHSRTWSARWVGGGSGSIVEVIDENLPLTFHRSPRFPVAGRRRVLPGQRAVSGSPPGFVGRHCHFFSVACRRLRKALVAFGRSRLDRRPVCRQLLLFLFHGCCPTSISASAKPHSCSSSTPQPYPVRRDGAVPREFRLPPGERTRPSALVAGVAFAAQKHPYFPRHRPGPRSSSTC